MKSADNHLRDFFLALVWAGRALVAALLVPDCAWLARCGVAMGEFRGGGDCGLRISDCGLSHRSVLTLEDFSL